MSCRCQLCPTLEMETEGDRVGEERKEILHPHRLGQSNLFGLRPSDHAGKPPLARDLQLSEGY